MNFKRITQAGLGIFLSSFLIVSCRTKGDTIAIVSVRGNENQAVDNAQVVLYGSGTEGVVVLYDTVFTNSAGEAYFNFNDEYQLGQAGFAILDIEVTKGLETSHGIIKVEEEKTNKETIYLGI